MAPGAQAIVVMGTVVGAYGVRGWLKVRSHATMPDALLRHPTWWLRPPRGGPWREFRHGEGRVHSGTLVAALERVDTREAAQAMRGFDVGVPRSELPAAGEGEFYREDLTGLAVVNRSGELLGEVQGMVEHGAHPLLRVARPPGSPGAERLIPFVAPIVERVDVEAGRIDVDWGADYD